MEASSSSNRWAAWIDATASAVSLVIAIWLHHLSDLAVADAILRYGRNVDSGVLEAAAANVYFFPASAVLGVAAICIFCNFSRRRLIHWLAWILVVIPIVWLAASEVMRVAA